MNSWLKKKFQKEFTTSTIDAAKIAVSKQQQKENLRDDSQQQRKTIQEMSFRCPNCSTIPGPDNTINVTLRSDLLNNTELGDIITLEEVSRGPGFQEFLAAQLTLYFKFISNSSNNTFLASAKCRSSVTENGQSCSSAVPNYETRTRGTSQNQSQTCNTISQKELKLINPIEEPALSFIEEEDLREDDLEEDCRDDQIPLKGRSVYENTAENNRTIRSRTFCLQQRLEEELLPHSDDVPKLSLPVKNQRISSVKKISDKSVTKPRATEDAVNTSVVDKRTRTRNYSTSSVDETSEQPTKAEGRKRNLKESSNTATVSSSQSDKEIFKVPLPPQRKVNPSSERSSNKRNATTGAHAKENMSIQAKAEQTQVESSEMSRRKQPSVSRSEEPEQRESLYRSRLGRISKRPGNFWDPLAGNGSTSGTKETKCPSQVPEVKEKVNRTSKPVTNKPAAEIDSESGYSSVISGRKWVQDKVLTQSEASEEPEELSGSSKQTVKRPRAEESVKPRGTRSQCVGPTATKGDQVEDQTSHDGKKAQKKAVRPPKNVTEDILIENKARAASTAPVEKASSRPQSKAARESVRPAAVTKQNTARQVRQTAVQGADTRNIFSDSYSSSSDESSLASDTNRNRRNENAPRDAGRSRQWASEATDDRLLNVEDSFDDEESECRPARRQEKIDTHRSSQFSKQTTQDRLTVESSSDEEDMTFVRGSVAKRSANPKKPPQAVQKKQKTLSVPDDRLTVESSSDEEDTTIVRGSVVKRRAGLKNPSRAAQKKQKTFPDDRLTVESRSDEEDTTIVRGSVVKRRVGLKNPSQAAQKKQKTFPDDRLTVESSSDEEDTTIVRGSVIKRRAGLKNPSQAAQKKQKTLSVPDDRLTAESSSDEEDTTIVRGRVDKKRAGLKKPFQAAQKKQKNLCVQEKSPVVHQEAQGRRKGRFIFSGSSTDEDSVCSYQMPDTNRKRAGSGSFVDDASYMSGTGSSLEKENHPEEKRRRRPRVVSRFRI